MLHPVYKRHRVLPVSPNGVIIHPLALLSEQFSYELLALSRKHRLYLILQLYLLRPHLLPRPIAYRVLPSGGIVVEPSPLQSFAADCPISGHFLPSRLPLFQSFVVAARALRGFQQFRCCPVRISFSPYLHIYFYIC